MIKFSVIEGIEKDGKCKAKVIARLDNCSMDAYNILCKRLPDYMEIKPCAVQLPNTFKAVAKCHPDDEFDVEKGMALTKEHVIEKYNAAMTKVLMMIGNDVDMYLDDIDTRLEYFED